MQNAIGPTFLWQTKGQVTAWTSNGFVRPEYYAFLGFNYEIWQSNHVPFWFALYGTILDFPTFLYRSITLPFKFFSLLKGYYYVRSSQTFCHLSANFLRHYMTNFLLPEITESCYFIVQWTQCTQTVSLQVPCLTCLCFYYWLSLDDFRQYMQSCS